MASIAPYFFLFPDHSGASGRGLAYLWASRECVFDPRRARLMMQECEIARKRSKSDEAREKQRQEKANSKRESSSKGGRESGGGRLEPRKSARLRFFFSVLVLEK